jgi:nucleoside-diphosphate-sugar epimerase
MIALTANGALAQAFLKNRKAKVISYRTLGEPAFLERIREADTIIHNASAIQCDDVEHALSSNFDVTRALVRTLEENNPGAHLVYISSMSMLDPACETMYRSPLEMDAYAYSKYLAETFILKSSLARVSSVRFSTLFYGDPSRDGLSRLVSDAAKHDIIELINDGESRRDFLPLSVATEYIEKICNSQQSGKACFTLASGHSTSFREVAQILETLSPTLRIKNKIIENTQPVLCEFSKESIERIGEVNFSLTKDIENYFNSLKDAS